MQTYMVGGAVRDKLMGMSPKDIDYVVVGATAADMLAMGFKQVGADFPVFLSDDGTEYALARTERKTGRGYMGFETDASPDVTLEQDLERRDLTINAMAMYSGSVDKTTFALCDPFGGKQDLCDKVLRHVSPAFADDPVRVLRLARFHARYGEEWTVAPETLDFCRKMVADGELAFLTRERVWKELEKALSEPRPDLFFSTLQACGAMEVVFPELAAFLQRSKMLMEFFRSDSVELNYAAMVRPLTPGTRALFEQRLRVPNDLVVVADLFGDALDYLRNGREDEVVEFLYEADVFRKRASWDRLIAATHALHDHTFDHINDALEVVAPIGFSDLPVEVQLSARGKEIAAHIKQARKEALEKAMAGW